MKIESNPFIPDVKIIERPVYSDHRGFFTESLNPLVEQVLGVTFVQDNHSMSHKYVIRGIHYQWNQPMGKLCRVVKGSGMDVAVDLRANSPTFGKYVMVYLSEDNFKQVWVPPGFGHAFISLEDETHFCYSCSAVHNAESEGAICPLDTTLMLDLPFLRNKAIISDKDKNAKTFEDYKLDPKF
jgi:dTDP-4-dehydrorhamnose 3,5-epimerase